MHHLSMIEKLKAFRRFFHWGPIIALSIIKCITFMTLYMNSMWWPPNGSLGGLLNQTVFLLLSSIATFNYAMATLHGPGFLPKGWRPKVARLKDLLVANIFVAIILLVLLAENPKDEQHLQYCKVCEGFKAPRAHHCKKCDRCVMKMDHHCPWINNCVGWANHAHFTYFLAFSILGSFHASILLICSFYRGIHRYYYLTHGLNHLATVQFGLISIVMCIFSLGLAIGVVIALGMLLYFQLKSIVTNQTGIESWIVEKALYRRNQNSEDDFVYPYDLGAKENVKQVLNLFCQPVGDGIDWPILESCDQYTLTREQLSQKQEKRARTKTFKAIRPATGSYIPLFSQGFQVCLSSPCTDEPRIKLLPGDIIKVTRFRRHWLFGERVVEELDVDLKRTGPIRGWFPRRCTVELIEPEMPSENENKRKLNGVANHLNNKKKVN